MRCWCRCVCACACVRGLLEWVQNTKLPVPSAMCIRVCSALKSTRCSPALPSPSLLLSHTLKAARFLCTCCSDNALFHHLITAFITTSRLPAATRADQVRGGAQPRSAPRVWAQAEPGELLDGCAVPCMSPLPAQLQHWTSHLLSLHPWKPSRWPPGMPFFRTHPRPLPMRSSMRSRACAATHTLAPRPHHPTPLANNPPPRRQPRLLRWCPSCAPTQPPVHSSWACPLRGSRRRRRGSSSCRRGWCWRPWCPCCATPAQRWAAAL